MDLFTFAKKILNGVRRFCVVSWIQKRKYYALFSDLMLTCKPRHTLYSSTDMFHQITVSSSLPLVNHSKKQRITMIIVFTVIVSIKNLTTFTISRKVNLKQSDYQEKYLVQSPVKHLWWSLFAKVVKQLVIIFDENLYYIFFSGGENPAKQIFYEI